MEIPEPVKKYWPYALGGIVGLYLLTRGSSAPAATGTDYSALIASQNAAAASQGQLGLQSQTLQDQLQVQLAQIAGAQNIASTQADASTTVAGYQRDTALAATAAAINDSNNQAQVMFISAQAQLAGNAGTATAGIITALQQPTIAAINGATASDIATVQAAADAAKASYNASAATSMASSASVAGILPSFMTGTAVSPSATTGIYGLTTGVVGAQAAGQAGQAATDAAAEAKKRNDAWQGIGAALAVIAA